MPASKQTELIEAAEHSQIRGREGSLEHVEAFRVDNMKHFHPQENLDAYPTINALSHLSTQLRRTCVSEGI